MWRILLLALLWPMPCSAQILIQPVPHATSYWLLAGQPPRAVITPITKEEDDKFHEVYTAALKADAELDAEGDALSGKENEYRKGLLAAMVKADPKLAWLTDEATYGSMTQEQHDQVLKDQDDAMKADPKLRTDWDELAKKLSEHQKKVDALMIKTDPGVSSILTKLSP